MTLDNLNSTQERGEGIERAATEPPLTFTRALKRNPFFRDEDGQAMVEMAIIAPFLMFAMVTVMYYWGMADMQQDFYIRSANNYWAVVATGHNPSAAGRTVTASDQDMGIGTMVSALGISLPSFISGIGDINGVMTIGLPAMALLDNDFTSNPIQALEASAGVFGLFPPGTPYKRMGLLKNNDYDETNTPAYAYDNPWRNTLMGMVSFFAASRGGEQEDPVETIFPSPLNMYANFRMINGPTWHCNRSPEGTEWHKFIGVASSSVTTMAIPIWGAAVQLNMGLASPIWMATELIVSPIGAINHSAGYTAASLLGDILPASIIPSAAHNPYAFKIDTGKGFLSEDYETYKTERLLGFVATGPGNKCATLTGSVEEMWR